MSAYTLNDNAFDPTPLTLYVPTGAELKVDENILQESFKNNRDLMRRMEKEFEERKRDAVFSTDLGSQVN